ncbi:hypothetical protein [Mogibacterium timidum]|uniref:hypothetical protein n=1 Tax=Mogibacterium timidum TaxID=35519 RepID=UPI00248B8024|nr:hypothetical protein [Mogibacterium timidum]
MVTGKLMIDFFQFDNMRIENEKEWMQMAQFYAEWLNKFYDVIVPYITVDWQ